MKKKNLNQNPNQDQNQNLNQNQTESFSDEANLIEEQKKIVNEFETLETQKKETRGRKRREETEKLEQAKIFGATVSKLGTYSFGLLISRWFPDQPLNPEEEKSLNEAVQNVAVKYVGIVGKYQEETALALCLVFIFLPRYLNKKSKDKENENLRNDKEGQS